MSTFAAVMTGKGTGAIATIQVFGGTAEAVIKKIFKPAGPKPPQFKTGKILLGTIADGQKTIDHVTIGCEAANTLAINCHGNPLIVADIMKLLQRRGAKLLSSQELLTKILSTQKSLNTIAIEAKLAQLKAKTIHGTKLIANQINAGLSSKLTQWLQNINEISLDQISSDTRQILKNSRPAKLIIAGCTITLSGPPNSGKSTLLNYLAGREKAIVTDIKGTTRDWVSAQCRIEPLSVTLIDTAGLGRIKDRRQKTEDRGQKQLVSPATTSQGHTPVAGGGGQRTEDRRKIERASQQKSIQILEQADLVLLILDSSQPADQLNDQFSKKIAGKRTITVLNKSDLPAKFDPAKLPEALSDTVQISAKFGTGIEQLKQKILQIAGVADFDLQTPICFTARQQNLLKQLQTAKSKAHAALVITELLNAQV